MAFYHFLCAFSVLFIFGNAIFGSEIRYGIVILHGSSSSASLRLPNSTKGIQSLAAVLLNFTSSFQFKITIQVNASIGDKNSPDFYSFFTNNTVSEGILKNEAVLRHFKGRCDGMKATNRDLFEIPTSDDDKPRRLLIFTFKTNFNAKQRLPYYPCYCFYPSTMLHGKYFGKAHDSKLCVESSVDVETFSIELKIDQVQRANFNQLAAIVASREPYSDRATYLKINEALHSSCPAGCLPYFIANGFNENVKEDEFDCRIKDVSVENVHEWWRICPSFRSTGNPTRHFFASSKQPSSNKPLKLDCIAASSKLSSPTWYRYDAKTRKFVPIIIAARVGTSFLTRTPADFFVLRCVDSEDEKLMPKMHEIYLANASKYIESCQIANETPIQEEIYLDQVMIVNFKCRVKQEEFWPIVRNYGDQKLEFAVDFSVSIPPYSPKVFNASDSLEVKAVLETKKIESSTRELAGKIIVDPSRLANLKTLTCDETNDIGCRAPKFVAFFEILLRSKGDNNAVQFRNLLEFSFKILTSQRPFLPAGTDNECQEGVGDSDCWPMEGECRPAGSAYEWFECPKLGALPKINDDKLEKLQQERMIIPASFSSTNKEQRQDVALPCPGISKVTWMRYNSTTKEYEPLRNHDGEIQFLNVTTVGSLEKIQFAILPWSRSVSHAFRCKFGDYGKKRDFYVLNTALYIKRCGYEIEEGDRYSAQAVVQCSLTEAGVQLFKIYKMTNGFPIDLSEYTFLPTFIENPAVTTASELDEYDQVLQIGISINTTSAVWRPGVVQTTGTFKMVLHLGDTVDIEPIEPFPVFLYARGCPLLCLKISSFLTIILMTLIICHL